MKGKFEGELRGFYEDMKGNPGKFVKTWTNKLSSDGAVYDQTTKEKAAEIARISAGMGLIFVSPFLFQEEQDHVLEKKEYQLFSEMNDLYSSLIWEANTVIYHSLKFAINGHYNMANSLLRNILDLVLRASLHNVLSHHIFLITMFDEKRFESTFLSHDTSTDADKKSVMSNAPLVPELKKNFKPLFEFLLDKKNFRSEFYDTGNLYHWLSLAGNKCPNDHECLPRLDKLNRTLYKLETKDMLIQLDHYDLLKPFVGELTSRRRVESREKLLSYIDYDSLCKNVHESVDATDVARRMYSTFNTTLGEEDESEIAVQYLPDKFDNYHERATKLIDVTAFVFVNMINAWLEEQNRWKEYSEPEIISDSDIVIEEIYSKILEELFTLRDYFDELGLRKTVVRINQLSKN